MLCTGADVRFGGKCLKSWRQNLNHDLVLSLHGGCYAFGLAHNRSTKYYDYDKKLHQTMVKAGNSCICKSIQILKIIYLENIQMPHFPTSLKFCLYCILRKPEKVRWYVSYKVNCLKSHQMHIWKFQNEEQFVTHFNYVWTDNLIKITSDEADHSFIRVYTT